MKKLIALASCLLTLTQVQAATISVVGSTTQTVFLEGVGGGARTLATVGDRAVVGFFTNFTGSNLGDLRQGLAATKTATEISEYLSANFVPIGAGGPNLGSSSTLAVALVSGAVSVSGGATGATLNFVAAGPTALANSVNAGGVVRGTRMFLLIFDDPSPAAATQLGVFGAENWLVPTTTSTIMNMSLNSVDIDAEVIRGARGSLILAPFVPEPSTGIMALIAGLGLVSRRRR